MQGIPSIKKQLNQLLKNELTAINQFFLHARMCRHWGLESLNNKEYKASIRAMKSADKLIERILFLEGLPNLQDLGKLMIGEDVPELIQGDLHFRTACQHALVTAIADCETEQDYVTRELLNDILEEVEEHIDWLEMQAGLIEKTGLQNYLQSSI
ncbi:MAG: bacterioferritin [Methyloprofundus sp.]|nr:bacterioferritin [Methyloprofundus sp.]